MQNFVQIGEIAWEEFEKVGLRHFVNCTKMPNELSVIISLLSLRDKQQCWSPHHPLVPGNALSGITLYLFVHSLLSLQHDTHSSFFNCKQ